MRDRCPWITTMLVCAGACVAGVACSGKEKPVTKPATADAAAAPVPHTGGLPPTADAAVAQVARDAGAKPVPCAKLTVADIPASCGIPLEVSTDDDVYQTTPVCNASFKLGKAMGEWIVVVVVSHPDAETAKAKNPLEHERTPGRTVVKGLGDFAVYFVLPKAKYPTATLGVRKGRFEARIEAPPGRCSQKAMETLARTLVDRLPE